MAVCCSSLNRTGTIRCCRSPRSALAQTANLRFSRVESRWGMAVVTAQKIGFIRWALNIGSRKQGSLSSARQARCPLPARPGARGRRWGRSGAPSSGPFARAASTISGLPECVHALGRGILSRAGCDGVRRCVRSHVPSVDPCHVIGPRRSRYRPLRNTKQTTGQHSASSFQ